ncbi:MAG: LysE family translocator [Alphaproteobacteria bacterium]
MNTADLLLYALTSVAVILMPGPGMLFVISTGIAKGTGASVVAAFGTTTGISVHIAAAALGLAVLMKTSLIAFQVVKIVGVIYLLYLAWQTIRNKEEFSPGRHAPASNHKAVFVRGMLANALNPKLSVFFLAFLPQFITKGPMSPEAQTLMLGTAFMAMTTVLFIGYGLLAVAVRRYILSQPWVRNVIRYLFASLFVGLGVRLALSDRQ